MASLSEDFTDEMASFIILTAGDSDSFFIFIEPKNILKRSVEAN